MEVATATATAVEHNTANSDVESGFGSEVDSDVEAGLKVRKSRNQYAVAGGNVSVPGFTKADDNGDGVGDGEASENSAYLDKYGGAIEDLDIRNLLNSVRYGANEYVVAETAINATTGITEAEAEDSEHLEEQIEEEIVEEEVVELEFEKAIPKLETHTMHCPNCDHHITKVVLRRKIIKRKPQVTEKHHKPFSLFGCFSCFSLFTSTDNGRFNPFPIFGNKPSASAGPQADGSGVVKEDGNCLSIFRVFRREKDPEQLKPRKVDKESEQSKPELDRPAPPTAKPQPPIQPVAIIDRTQIFDPDYTGDKGGPPIQPVVIIDRTQIFDPDYTGEKGRPSVGGPSDPEKQPLLDGVPSHPDDQLHLGVKLPEKPESVIDIPTVTPPRTQSPLPGSTGQDSTSYEILKSIVYGGLMEVIASLSIVASAAAGDATTQNIIALALANLIGGVFLIGHNLWDLKDDCYKFSTQQTPNEESRTKYKELLGSIEHFPLHAFFAILSFLVFGIIPPVTYGYSFNETNDRDITVLIVAAASFVCVGLLAIFRAYIDRCTGFAGYAKTIVYYLTTAVTVSGVSYAAGNLVKRLIEEYGWFETGSTVGTMVLPEPGSVHPSLAYY